MWSTDTSSASGGSMDHGGLSERSNPETEPSWTSCYCSEPDQSYSSAAHFRAELESQLKVAAHHLVSPSHLQPIPPLQLSHMATIMSLVLPLQHSFITPFLYLSHLSIKYLFVVVALQTAVCHVALFPPRQLCIQIFNARSY